MLTNIKTEFSLTDNYALGGIMYTCLITTTISFTHLLLTKKLPNRTKTKDQRDCKQRYTPMLPVLHIFTSFVGFTSLKFPQKLLNCGIVVL